MQGYVILAQALASQNVKSCYGIVGTSYLTKEFQSLNSALPSKPMVSITTAAGTNSKQVILQDTLAILLEFLAHVFVSQAQATRTLLVESPMLG